MSTKSIAVFTAWPDLIRDQLNQFDIHLQDSCQQIIQDTFASNDVAGNLARYVAWTHDRKWYQEFDYCLFISQPMLIELSDFLHHLDNRHTTYYDDNSQIIFYQRLDVWQSKEIDIEKISLSIGVIFIDNWQVIQDLSVWPNRPQNFDFYENMKNQLSRYPIKNKVFHTGQYGGLPLADKLQEWNQDVNSREIMEISLFQDYYQQQKIFNWIVVGAHWQRCTHDKPLGFLNLLELKKQDPVLQIYSHQECTVKFLNDDIDNPIVDTLNAQDYEKDSLTWRPNGNLHELILE